MIHLRIYFRDKRPDLCCRYELRSYAKRNSLVKTVAEAIKNDEVIFIGLFDRYVAGRNNQYLISWEKVRKLFANIKINRANIDVAEALDLINEYLNREIREWGHEHNEQDEQELY